MNYVNNIHKKYKMLKKDKNIKKNNIYKKY